MRSGVAERGAGAGGEIGKVAKSRSRGVRHDQAGGAEDTMLEGWGGRGNVKGGRPG